jgi:3-oxoacyl-[acyl-carrier-protein] synthase I
MAAGAATQVVVAVVVAVAVEGPMDADPSEAALAATVTATAVLAAIDPVAITAYSVVCAAGIGQAALLQALRHNTSALRPSAELTSLEALLGSGQQSSGIGTGAEICSTSRFTLATTALGWVPELASAALPAAWRHWDCRATRLAWWGLQADGFLAAVQNALQRYGAARVGLVLGTSAATIAVSEHAYRHLQNDQFPAAVASERLNTLHAPAMFVQEALGLQGPCTTVSTACSSSAKAFAQAQRWLQLGLADAVVVAGVDALAASTVYGFRALGLLSGTTCRPFDCRRDGISIGEAAAFALLERNPAGQALGLQLKGYGESNDAFHMSSPHPQGLGAERAIQDALCRAGLQGHQVDYVNLHGTSTPKNDEIEALVLARCYGPQTRASATKGLTGHAMGAAGSLEAVVCLLALQHGLLPGTAHTTQPEPAIQACLQLTPQAAALQVAASHSFGFGGNNCVLIFGKGPTP